MKGRCMSSWEVVVSIGQDDQTAMRSTDFDVNFNEPDLLLVPPSTAPVLLSTLQSASLSASGREIRSAMY
jgi:hypothetical protein